MCGCSVSLSKPAGRAVDIYYTSLCGKGMLSRFVVTDVSSHGASVGEPAKKLRDLMHKTLTRSIRATSHAH